MIGRRRRPTRTAAKGPNMRSAWLLGSTTGPDNEARTIRRYWRLGS